MLASLVSGKGMFFSSFSIGNNLGLIAPVLLAIVLWKDFSFGTIRNKVIAGKSRTAIFMSLFITCAVVMVGVMLLHAFATLGISLLFFDYQAEPFTMADFWYFLESLVFEVLVLLFVAALLSWLCANMKNVGLVIVLYVAVAFVLALAASMLHDIIIPLMEMIGEDQTTIDILKFFDRINVGGAVYYIGLGTEYTLEDVLYLTIPSMLGIAGLLGHSLWRFNKKDLK